MKFVKFALKTLLEQDGFIIGVVFAYGLSLTFVIDIAFSLLSNRLWGWSHNIPFLSLSWLLIWMIGFGILVMLVLYHKYRTESEAEKPKRKNDEHEKEAARQAFEGGYNVATEYIENIFVEYSEEE